MVLITVTGDLLQAQQWHLAQSWVSLPCLQAQPALAVSWWPLHNWEMGHRFVLRPPPTLCHASFIYNTVSYFKSQIGINSGRLDLKRKEGD